MKQLTCEMCGSTDLIKQDGVFVCQSCGCKYSVEEAKKMMIEGTVDIQGTVKVDDTNEINNLVLLARRAKDENNTADAQKYYEQILLKQPTSWEASFYSKYFKSMNSKVGEIETAAISLANSIENTILLIKNENNTNETTVNIIAEIVTKLCLLTDLFYDNAKCFFDKFSNDDNSFVDFNKRVESCFICLVGTHSIIKKHFGENNEIMAVACSLQKTTVNYYINMYNSLYSFNPIYATGISGGIEGLIEPIIKEIETYDSSYKSPVLQKNQATNRGETKNDCALENQNSISENDDNKSPILKKIDNVDGKLSSDDLIKITQAIERGDKITAVKIVRDSTGMELAVAKDYLDKNFDTSSTNSSSTATTGGCYIATCVYGSYDCPQVWTLRRYRDDTLASTWYGRAFIRTYYALSPTIVKWFGNTKWFKKIWKNKLDKMVSNLRSNGVEDTPYQDKDWR